MAKARKGASRGTAPQEELGTSASPSAWHGSAEQDLRPHRRLGQGSPYLHNRVVNVAVHGTAEWTRNEAGVLEAPPQGHVLEGRWWGKVI